ncbi:MAG: hypothetical protein IPK86_03260 [Neisseriales bacterium]|nr:MAG: hypothetical protein IPK86_03260 [Neisseriales bacterium]
MKKYCWLAALVIASSLPVLSCADDAPLLPKSHSESLPSFFDFWDYDITVEAGIEKTLSKDESFNLSHPILIGNFDLEVKGVFPVAPTTSKTSLLWGTHMRLSPQHLAIKDVYAGVGFQFGQLKYGLLTTLPENPLADYWKGEGANNIAIYNNFDTLLKNAYRFQSTPLNGFSFHLIRGTSGYITGATNKPDITFTISDIPVTGYGFQFQDKGLTMGYTTFTKEGDAQTTVAPRGTYILTTPSTPSPGGFPDMPGFGRNERSTSPSTSTQSSADTSNKDIYIQRQIKIGYDQHPLWWQLGYQQKQSREGWGDVSSVMPVTPSQKAIDVIKEDIGLLNEILQNPDIKFTWPWFKTHEILAGIGYTFGQFRPKAMVVFGTIDKSSRRNICIDVSQCDDSICQVAEQRYGQIIEREVPMSDYRQYILGIDYLVNTHTTLGVSCGKINWLNHDYGSDETLQELGAWQNKQSFGLHISHRF